MNSIDTIVLVESLKSSFPKGLEVSISNGILRVTKNIYLRDLQIFEYTNELNIDFNPNDGVSISEFIEVYKQTKWQIENETC
jgi:hypothetical protein